MVFLDPRSDIAFKKLFGDMKHKNLLIHFLNNVLDRTNEKKIVSVVFNDPYNIPETIDGKQSIVDVRCTDQAGNQYIIEMQVVEQKGYAARAQFYSSLAFSKQLFKRDNYDKLVPVIFVGILDFELFKNNNYLTHHFILDNETHEHALTHLTFHFIELPKFHKELEELATVLDKWLYFLKNANILQKIPASLKTTEITEAFGVLERGNWSMQELEAYERYWDAIRSSIGQIDAAENRGIKKGEIKGERKKALEMAKKLLKIHDVKTVAEIAELTVTEVEELKELQ